jgi:hypothetical protein
MPVPSFGHAGYAWPLDLNADPGDLAALYLQHRVIVAARERLGERATAPEFADALAQSGSGQTKQVQRQLCGAKLSVSDLLHWCHTFDVDLGGIVRQGLREPENYPPLYRAVLDAEVSKPARFRSRDQVDWDQISLLLHAATVESLSTGIGEFLTSDVLRLQALRSLTQTGMPPELIRARPGGIELLGANAQSLGIAASLSENEEDWLSLLRLLISPQGLDGVIVFLNPVAAARTNSHLPGLLQTQTGQTFEVSASAHEHLRNSHEFNETRWKMLAIETSEGLTVAVLSLKRSA